MEANTLRQSSKFEDWCSKCNLRPISKEYGDVSITLAEGKWTGRQISRYNQKVFGGSLPDEKSTHWVILYGIQLGPTMELCKPILFSVHDCLNKGITALDRRKHAIRDAMESKQAFIDAHKAKQN